jgi:hypothetical protein
MRYLILIFALSTFAFSCKSNQNTVTQKDEIAEKFVDNDTVRIASDKTEYEIIIFEPGFNYWLKSRARPEGYYSQSFLESRNNILVIEWNIRVNQPQRYNSTLYDLRIDYDRNIDYGYELNYKLYNYFVYFQIKNKQKLAGYIPRI